MKFLLLSAFLCAPFVMAATTADRFLGGQMKLVTDREGDQLRGGACDGSEWDDITVYCNEGTVLCMDESYDCTDIALSTLVDDGDGDQIENQSAEVACSKCSTGTKCGKTVHITKSTKKCS